MMLGNDQSKKKQTMMTSLDRDIYTQIVGYKGGYENNYVAKATPIMTSWTRLIR